MLKNKKLNKVFIFLCGVLFSLTLLHLKGKSVEVVTETTYIFTHEKLDTTTLASELYNVPIYLIKAIERHETGNYTSLLYRTKNNTFGCTKNDGERCGFDSVDQSTLELARTLAFKYKVQGDDFDLNEIVKDFCQNSCETWVKSVEELIKEEK